MKVVTKVFIILLFCCVPLTANADTLESLILEDLLLEELLSGEEQQDDKPEPVVVIVCEFTCTTPIVRCGNWSPPPGSYSTDIFTTRSNAETACRAKAHSICQRCGGGGVASYWYTIYRSVRWTTATSSTSGGLQ